MSENEKTPQKNYGPFVKLVVATMFLVAMVVLATRDCRQARQSNEKYRPSFERATAQLQELADKGCQVPFEDCLHPYSAVQLVLDAMDRENIEFGTRGVTPDKLTELEVQAEIRIASQELAYLKAKGGAKLPSDLNLLSNVCMQVYTEKRTLLGGNPTVAEFKQLLPPTVTKVDGCWWDDNKQKAVEKAQQEAQQQAKEWQEKYNPTYEQALTRLQALAQNGCQAPIKDCPQPNWLKRQIFEAMNREDIGFGAGDMSLDELEKLAAKAEVRIASQKFAYLKSIGGVKRPSDLELLEEICMQVYAYKRKLLPNHPTDAELKKLMPPGVTNVNFCHWDEKQKPTGRKSN